MRLVAVGRLKAGPERELVTRYLERTVASGRPLGLSQIMMDEIDESRARRADDRRVEEARAIAARAAGHSLVMLDERGRDLTSEAFAQDLAADRDAGQDVAFVVGGPDGIDPGLLAQAARQIRFGAMTLPHGLVRVLLMEQIYRAVTILAGHPYHRGAGHREGD